MSEEWRPVLGYEGSYEVSDLGRVRSLTRRVTDRTGVTRTWHGRPVTPIADNEGRLEVRLYLNGKQSTRRVHRLVLESFVSPRPDGMEGCHYDGDPTNNHLSNLRWDTKSGNSRDSLRHGTHAMAARQECSEGHPLDGYRGRARYCKTCHRERQRPIQRAKYIPRAELPVCPGSGRRTFRPASIREPDRCPVCDRRAYVRVDGTTGIHPVRVAKERRLTAAKEGKP